MAIELFVALSILLSGVVAGYVMADAKSRKKCEEELGTKTRELNINLVEFSKAYASFNDRALEMDTRLTSLEFRVNGTADSKR